MSSNDRTPLASTVVESPQSDSDYCDKREAEFLASQQARLDKIRTNAEQKNSTLHQDATADNTNAAKQRKDFWIILKSICASLNVRLSELIGEEERNGANDNESNANEEKRNDLDSLSSPSTLPLYVTAQQRNEALNKLQEIQFTIRCLGHYTLRSNKFTSRSNTREIEQYLPNELVQFTMPELPNADLRLLNTEIEKLKSKVQVAQSIIIPKEKFRFRRYRQALQKRKEEFMGAGTLLDDERAACSTSDDNANLDLVDSSEENAIGSDIGGKEGASHKLLFDGITLADRDNCYIRVQDDGHFTVSEDAQILSTPSSKNDNKNKNDQNQSTSKAFLMRDLDSCQILVEGSYSSLHIMNSKNTTIRMITPISGPCHVTNCNDSNLTLSFCRQLRIHDCTNVSFYVHVGSGPIIEGCKGMKFYQCDYDSDDNFKKEQNLYWDVKDFHWLKNLVKSPNFEVYSMEQQVAEAEAEHRQQQLLKETTDVHSESVENAGSNDVGIVSQDDDSSDEDEL